MFNSYLHQVGLAQFEKVAGTSSLNNIVSKAFREGKRRFTQKELSVLYTYDVPLLGPDGTCSISHAKEPKPYNLAQSIGLHWDNPEGVLTSNHTERLWRLGLVTSNETFSREEGLQSKQF